MKRRIASYKVHKEIDYRVLASAIYSKMKGEKELEKHKANDNGYQKF